MTYFDVCSLHSFTFRVRAVAARRTFCDTLFNVFDDCKDAQFYMACDRINTHCLIPSLASIAGAGGGGGGGKKETYDVVLGCQDKCVLTLVVWLLLLLLCVCLDFFKFNLSF